MTKKKPSYSELEKRIEELEKENLRYRKMQSSLEESEERLLSILDNSPAVIYVKDNADKYIFINRRYEELFHVTRSDFVGKTDYDVFPAEMASKLQENDRKIISRNAPLEFEEIVLHDDGPHTYLSSKFPLKKADGINYAVCGISSDITERKRIEEELQKAHDVLEQRVAERTGDLTEINEKLKKEIAERREIARSLYIYKYAVENASDAIGMSTPEGRHWYQNRAFNELFGEVGSDPPASLYVSEAKGREVFQTIMAGGQWSGELEMKSPGGRMLVINLRAYAIKDDENKIIGLVGMHTDITRQKTAENALQVSEKNYRDLISRIPDLLYRTNMNGEIVFVSPSVFSLCGYTVEESIGMKMAEQVYLYPEERNVFLNTLNEKGYINNFEARLVRKDGSVWWASTNAHFYRDEEGDIQGIEGITRDITNLKTAEKEREEFAQQLNREEKMKSLGLMAGGIAHDLNNILSGIVSYPDYILMKLPGDSPLRRHVETIKDSGIRAADVVSDLLTIARGVAAGKEILNMNQLIRNHSLSAEHMELEKRYSAISFQYDLDPDLLNMYGSEVHLNKILMNLERNAVESIPGEGTVLISSRNRYLDKPLKGYDTNSIGEYIMVSISDTGTGIPKENLDRIFEPFYTKKVMGKSGTGLGLAVVWNAVQDHGGYINLESSESGTVFELYFQVDRENIQYKGKSDIEENINGDGELILVIDDEEQQREIAGELLKQLGYEVHSVSSGEKALEYLELNHADIIILDMIMEPGIDGLETYRRILKIKPDQKAVITSGYSETARVMEAQSLGAGTYIKKPYLIKTIGKAIKEELRKK